MITLVIFDSTCFVYKIIEVKCIIRILSFYSVIYFIEELEVVACWTH